MQPYHTFSCSFGGPYCSDAIFVVHTALLQFWWIILYCCNFGDSYCIVAFFGGSYCTDGILMVHTVLMQFWWFILLKCCNFRGSFCIVAILVVNTLYWCNSGGLDRVFAISVDHTVLLPF